MTTKEQQASRYTLTEKGLAATDEHSRQRALIQAACEAGHHITVTPGPFGRAYVDCSCSTRELGRLSVHATKRSANTAALRHAEEVTR